MSARAAKKKAHRTLKKFADVEGKEKAVLAAHGIPDTLSDAKYRMS